MKNPLRIASVLLSVLLAPAALADYTYRYYQGDWSVLPDFDALTPVETGTVATFDISVRNRDSQYGFVFEGTVTAAVADTYTFYTNSDDGSQLLIDGVSKRCWLSTGNDLTRPSLTSSRPWTSAIPKPRS